MRTIEEVIRGLKCIGGVDDDPLCGDCPYRKLDEECEVSVSRDALEVFRSFEPIVPNMETDARGIHFTCPKCKTIIWTQRDTATLEANKKYYRFCHYCGQRVG